MNTCDLVDQYADEIQVTETIGLKHYGQQQRFSGRIQTLKCFEDNSLLKKIVSAPNAASVLVVDGGGSMRCAMVGDLIAALAVKHGWRGIIVNGCIRDSSALQHISIGIMALGTNPKKSSKLDQGEIGIPIAFAGVNFETGDYLYADEDGIVVAKRDLAKLSCDE
jgi:regulator of ribonuclease activity A